MSYVLDHTKFAASMDADYPGFGETWRFAITHLKPLESHIEAEFLAQWVLVTFERNSSSYAGTMPRDDNSNRLFDLEAQRQWGNYRVDFALSVFAGDGEMVATAVIETDGFAYHKDRATFEADRARDQFFLKHGIVCFRFTKRSLQAADALDNLITWSRQVRPLGFGTPDARMLDELAVRGCQPKQMDLRAVTKRSVEAAIWSAREDLAEMKQRILLAWEHRHLTSEEAEEWIVLHGLESA